MCILNFSNNRIHSHFWPRVEHGIFFVMHIIFFLICNVSFWAPWLIHMHNLNSNFSKLLYLDDNVHSSPIILRGTKTMCWLFPRSAKWYNFVAKYTHITYITYHGYPLNLSDAVKLFLKILFGHYFCFRYMLQCGTNTNCVYSKTWLFMQEAVCWPNL